MSTWIWRAREGLKAAMGGQQTYSRADDYDQRFKAFDEQMEELRRMKESMELWSKSLESFINATSHLSDSWQKYYQHAENLRPTENHSMSFPEWLEARSTAINQPSQTESSTMSSTTTTSSSSSSHEQWNGPPPSPYLQVSQLLHSLIENLKADIQPAVRDIFNQRCIAPVDSMLELLPEIYKKHSARKHSIAEFEAYRAKYDGKEKKGQKILDAEKKVRVLQEEILLHIREFEVSRPLALGPELVAFAGCIGSVAGYLNKSSTALYPTMPQMATTILQIQEKVRSRRSNSGPLLVDTFRATEPLIPPICFRTQALGGRTGGYVPVSRQEMLQHLSGLSFSNTETRKESFHETMQSVMTENEFDTSAGLVLEFGSPNRDTDRLQVRSMPLTKSSNDDQRGWSPVKPKPTPTSSSHTPPPGNRPISVPVFSVDNPVRLRSSSSFYGYDRPPRDNQQSSTSTPRTEDQLDCIAAHPVALNNGSSSITTGINPPTEYVEDHSDVVNTPVDPSHTPPPKPPRRK